MPDQKEQYFALLEKYVELTTKQLRARAKVEKLGLHRDIEEEITFLDRERSKMHRELEALGREIGKSEHQVRQEIAGVLFSSGRESKIPGLTVVPVPFDPELSELLFDQSENFVSKKAKQDFEDSEFALRKPQIGEDDDYRRAEPETKRGFYLVYNMRNYFGGEERLKKGLVKDGGAELKQERMQALLEQLKKQFPKGDFSLKDWEINYSGAYHDYYNNIYDALFVEEEYLDRVLGIMNAEREKYWVTDSEYRELCTKVISEYRAEVVPKNIADFVDPKDKELAEEIQSSFNERYPDASSFWRNSYYANGDEPDYAQFSLSVRGKTVTDLQGNLISTERIVAEPNRGERPLDSEFLTELRGRILEVRPERVETMDPKHRKAIRLSDELKTLRDAAELDRTLDEAYNEQDEIEEKGRRRSSRNH